MGDPDLYGAIEGGGSKFVCAVGASAQQLHEQIRIDTREPAATLAAVLHFFEAYRPRLRALGVSCFGPLELDPARGRDFGALLSTPKRGWSGFALRAALADALAVPVAIDTDVNGAALAEARWGALRDADPAVYVTVGTGVGVGVLLGGRPLHGLLHPELGHLRAHDADFAGSCPFHGSCVEGLVSAPALRARTGCAPDALPDDHPVWARAAETLGHLLQTVVLAYSPQRVALGGGVLRRAGLLAATQRALVTGLSGYLPRPQLSWPAVTHYLVAPALGDHAGLLGGFALAQGVLSAQPPADGGPRSTG